MTESGRPIPVTSTDRVSDVLARDESLVEVFVRAAPHFSKLRNRAMRRVMARLVNVEQAARTAGIAPEKLVHDLNSALGIATTAGDEPTSPAVGASSKDAAGRKNEPGIDGADHHQATGSAMPAPGGRGQPGGGVREGADAATPTRPADAPVRELDVRADLRVGNEPFSKIMAAVAELADGQILRLRTIFEPVPLFTVLGKRGFVHESEEHGAEDWSIWFWRPVGGEATRRAHGADDVEVEQRSRSAAVPPGAEPARDAHTSTLDVSPGDATTDTSTPDVSAASGTTADGVIIDDTTLVLDVRGLDPPEPLIRTLTALETLPEGHQLLQINARVPQFLFPMLVERGFACDVDESRADRVLVRIWRPA